MDLKPCKRCGFSGTEDYFNWHFEEDEDGIYGWLRCPGCGKLIEGETKEELIDKWNSSEDKIMRV